MRRKIKTNGKLLNVQKTWTSEGVELKGDVPCRMTLNEAAELMSLKPSDMTALSKTGLLPPNGHGKKGKRKAFNSTYYCTQRLIRCMEDEAFWDEAQLAISEYNATKNGRADKSKDG